MKHYLFTIFILFLIFFSNTPLVLGQAWWGDGYRNPEWILSHGGTIIYFEISGSGSSDNYKAVLEQGGKYIEGEIGKVGKFDDAKGGMYVITAFKGGTDNRNGKSGEKISSITVSANPGETIHLFFNEKDKTVSFKSDRKSKKPNTQSPAPKANSQSDLPKPMVIPESVKKNWVIS